jgi:3-phosphoshikimate 1-carboxyvinyltransferase
MTERPPFIKTNNSDQLGDVLLLDCALGSKSISNRLLSFALFSKTLIQPENVLVSEDTNIMMRAPLSNLRERTIKSQVLIGWVKEFYVGNSGTTVRFLCPLFCFAFGTYLLHGAPRMHKRPIGSLIFSLRVLGANIKWLAENESLPLIINPPHTLRPFGVIKLGGGSSSQFVTAMLLGSELYGSRFGHLSCPPSFTVREAASRSYISLTLQLLERFGVVIEREGWTKYFPKTKPSDALAGGVRMKIETDLSSASYFLIFGLVGSGSLIVPNIPIYTLQGDSLLVGVVNWLGLSILPSHSDLIILGKRQCPFPMKLGCGMIPDAAMSLLTLSAFVRAQPNHFTQLLTWRFKETDRMLAMAIELRKFRLVVECSFDHLRIQLSLNRFRDSEFVVGIKTYKDHRMAMSCSVLCFLNRKIRIWNPGCVSKTFPDFFHIFNNLTIG